MVKVGDKVRVTGNEYPDMCPSGTICTVSKCLENGDIIAIIDGGDGFPWFFAKLQYEPITDEPENMNYAEQAAKYGIVTTIELADGNVLIFDGKK